MAARYRCRTMLRRKSPSWLLKLGFATKGPRDCGDHDWYNHDDIVNRCYHCEAGVRRREPKVP